MKVFELNAYERAWISDAKAKQCRLDDETKKLDQEFTNHRAMVWEWIKGRADAYGLDSMVQISECNAYIIGQPKVITEPK